MQPAATQFVNRAIPNAALKDTAQVVHPRQQIPPVAAELRAVMFPRYGAGSILGPGQLVPLWDVKAWRRTETPFELQGYFACTGADGAFACTNGNQSSEVLEDIVVLEESGHVGTDLSALRSTATAAAAVLSDVGGGVTIRPDDAPMGMIPFAGRKCLGGPALELHVATALDFHRMSRNLNATTKKPPEICFFLRTKQGAGFGWDVVSKIQVAVTPLPGLPASFYAVQDPEMGLLKAGDRYGDAYRTTMLAGVTDMLAGMGCVDGTIYAGFEMGNTPAEEKNWAVDDIGGDLELPLYVMPYQVQPLHALNPGAKGAAQAILRGDYRRPPMARMTLFSR